VFLSIAVEKLERKRCQKKKTEIFNDGNIHSTELQRSKDVEIRDLHFALLSAVANSN
jgi:hypothetical protein